MYNHMTQASQQAQEISPLFHHVKGLFIFVMYMEKGDRYGNLVTGEKLRQSFFYTAITKRRSY